MIPINIKKITLLGAALFILVAASLYFGLRSRTLSLQLRNERLGEDNFRKESLEIKGSYDKMQAAYAKLSREHQELLSERDNLLLRLKGLFAEGGRSKELAASLQDTKKEMQLLEKAREETLDQNLSLKEGNQDLLTIQKQLIREKEQLQLTLLQEKEKSGIKKIEDENDSLKAANKNLEASFRQKEIEAAKLKESESKLKGESAALSKRVDELSKNYASAVKKNRDFEDKLTNMPAKFAELARQNKLLIKRTANIHYNMGVFYTQHKEYARATAEFEKAIELAPDDAYSHFNLGYIYAEYLVDRSKAMEHFKQYIRFAKKEDKDVDWVKKYIITWDSWGAKQPME